MRLGDQSGNGEFVLTGRCRVKKKASIPGRVRMKAAKNLACPDATNVGIWPHPSLCRRSGAVHGPRQAERDDPDEHIGCDIRTPGFKPRSRLPTPERL